MRQGCGDWGGRACEFSFLEAEWALGRPVREGEMPGRFQDPDFNAERLSLSLY